MNVQALRLAIDADVPVLLMGPPGIGKTSAVADLADQLGYALEVFIGSLRDPTDIGGLPVVSSGQVELAPHRWVGETHKRKTILFLDELTSATPAVQRAALRVVLDRVVGDTPLGPGNRIVAAANPSDGEAGLWEVNSALSNRFCQLECAVDAAVWCSGVTGRWESQETRAPNPGWEGAVRANRAIVAGFIRARPALLHQAPQNGGSAPWPSPRSWTTVATLAAAAAGYPDAEGDLIAGTVGIGAAQEFITWRSQADLPSPAAILTDPEGAAIPSRIDVAWAVSGMVAAEAFGPKTTPTLYAAGLVYLGRMGAKHGDDLVFPAVGAALDARRRLKIKEAPSLLVRRMREVQE